MTTDSGYLDGVELYHVYLRDQHRLTISHPVRHGVVEMDGRNYREVESAGGHIVRFLPADVLGDERVYS
jgi:hypothetical protein